MKKTLVVFAHPYLEHSNSNAELINFYVRHQHFTLRDIYEEYPNFHIAAFRERKRIKNYDRFIFQFPLIWFGMPPLLKLWIDEVFDRDWLKEIITILWREKRFTFW
jgi:putative NADPH-quinone reductase